MYIPQAFYLYPSKFSLGNSKESDDSNAVPGERECGIAIAVWGYPDFFEEVGLSQQIGIMTLPTITDGLSDLSPLSSIRSATCTFPAAGSYPKAAQRWWPSVCQWIGDCPDSCGCHAPRCKSDRATHVFREWCLGFSYLGNPFFLLLYCDCSFFRSIFQLEGMFEMNNLDWHGMK